MSKYCLKIQKSSKSKQNCPLYDFQDECSTSTYDMKDADSLIEVDGTLRPENFFDMISDTPRKPVFFISDNKVYSSVINPHGEEQSIIKRLVDPKFLSFILDPTQKYILKPGSIFKLGRCILEVLETRDKVGNETTIVNKAQPVTFLRMEDKELITNSTNPDDIKANITEKNCRICCLNIEDGMDEGDYMISPCNCKGSCEFIHLSCLKKWIEYQPVKQVSQKVSTFNHKKLACDLCHELLPWKIIVENNIHTLIEFPKPETDPYILFEKIDVKDSKRTAYVVRPDDLPFYIGRAFTDDLKIDEISVSRQHCILTLDDAGFSIADNDSKYGTLIKMEEPIDISQHSNVKFVYTSFSISIEKCIDTTDEGQNETEESGDVPLTRNVSECKTTCEEDTNAPLEVVEMIKSTKKIAKIGIEKPEKKLKKKFSSDVC